MEIRLDNVCYENKINNINYVFEEGSITSIIGKSGSGKSLLSLIMMNVINNYDGNIIVDGIDNYDLYDYLRNVGYVFQDVRDHFICNVVKDEIAFGLRQYKYKIDKIDEHVNNALKMVGLSVSILKKNVIELSSGEAAKVALASSLVMNPKFLLLDEPTLYLDGNSKKSLLNLLLKLKNRYNKTIIIISNDMDFVYSLDGDYILLNDGEIKDRGKVKDWKYESDIFTNYEVERPAMVRISNYINNKYKLNLYNVKDIDELVEGCFGDE
ncbi:MAG: ABC transporter ATP-binding protein [Bacilli bacterium]|nr:ABC transporter ATP-binding protein [Bacilli bacterium]